MFTTDIYTGNKFRVKQKEKSTEIQLIEHGSNGARSSEFIHFHGSILKENH